MKKPIPPCKPDCPKRKLGCRSECPDWPIYEAEQAEYRKEQEEAYRYKQEFSRYREETYQRNKRARGEKAK